MRKNDRFWQILPPAPPPKKTHPDFNLDRHSMPLIRAIIDLCHTAATQQLFKPQIWQPAERAVNIMEPENYLLFFWLIYIYHTIHVLVKYGKYGKIW